MNILVDKLIANAKKSCFDIPRYEASIEIENFADSLSFFLNRALQKKYNYGQGTLPILELVADLPNHIPKFQRDNDKWSTEMQSSFISNLIKGYRSPPIVLYTIGETTCKTNCNILDGLQKITAIYEFFYGEMSVQIGDSELINNKVLLSEQGFSNFMMNRIINVNIFHFKTEIEAVEHYIEMNKNITYSLEDIQRAKDYLFELKAS